MLVWRICQAHHAATAFSGEGARRAGGRWNSKDVRMAYAAASLALAALELFVHVGPDEEPVDLIAVQANVQVNANENLASVKKLPKDWRFDVEISRRAGDAWAGSRNALAVLVPSVVVDVEWNVLINPVHQDFSQLKIVQMRPFRFDERMFRAADHRSHSEKHL